MAPLRHLLASLAALLVMATVVVTHAQTPAYDPTKVDWASVVDSCAAAFRFERRLGSFALRASFHDVASVTPQCATNPGPGCGGADGSLMLSADEQLHETNRVELFASNTARVVLPIAKKYGASVADTLHVCALVAPSILAYPASMPQGPKPRVVRMDLSLRSAVNSGFKVGRIDRVNAAGNDPALIPAAGMDLQQTADWFTSRGIPLDQAAALLGVHSLLRPKGCYVEDRIDPRTGAVRGCVPFAPNTPGGKAAIPRDTGPFVLQPGSCPMVVSSPFVLVGGNLHVSTSSAYPHTTQPSSRGRGPGKKKATRAPLVVLAAPPRRSPPPNLLHNKQHNTLGNDALV